MVEQSPEQRGSEARREGEGPPGGRTRLPGGGSPSRARSPEYVERDADDPPAGQTSGDSSPRDPGAPGDRDGDGGSPPGGDRRGAGGGGLLGPFSRLVRGGARVPDGPEEDPGAPEEWDVPRGSDVVARLALLATGALAFLLRVFSAVRFESVIHEFDPYFNYRVALYTQENGVSALLDWFDDRTWYPLGRVVGGSTYPGLIFTALLEWRALRLLHLDVSLKDVCVFTGPVFAALACWATYGVMTEARPGRAGVRAGLVAAFALAISPAYVSRSVAGSFDLEAVAIFAMMLTFWTYLKACNTGQLRWACAAALSLWYMALSWGGYTFVVALVPTHVVACVMTGRLSGRMYAAFAPFVALGTVMCCTVPPVNQNAVTATEHLPSFFAFALVHVVMLARHLRRVLPPRAYRRAKALSLGLSAAGAAAGLLYVAARVVQSPTLMLSARTLSLLDPTYAAKHIPIIASVSEHQPPTWASFMMDVGPLIVLAPAGVVLCLAPLTSGSLFLLVFGATSVWFTGVMVRLMLLLSPACCLLGGLAASWGLDVCTVSLKAAAGAALGWGAEADAAGEARREDAAWLAHEGLAGTDAAPAGHPNRPGLESLRSFRLGTSMRQDGEVALADASSTDEGEREEELSEMLAESLERSMGTSVEAEGPAAGPPRGPGEGRSLRRWAARVMREWGAQRPLRAGHRVLQGDVALSALALTGGLLTWSLLHSVWVSSDIYSSPSVWIPNKVRGQSFEAVDDFREAYSWLEHNTPPDAKVASWWDYGYQSTQMSGRTTLTDNNTWNTTHIATIGRAMASPERKAWEILRSLDVDYFFVVYGGMVNVPADDMSKLTWIMRITGKEFPEIKEDLIYQLDYTGSYLSIGPRGAPYLHSTLVYKLCYHRIAEAAHFYDMEGDLVRGEMPVPVRLDWFQEVYSTTRYLVRIYKLRDPPVRPAAPALDAA